MGLEVYGELQGSKGSGSVSKKYFEVYTHTLTTSSCYVMSDSYWKVLFRDGSGRVGRVGSVFVEINTNSARLGLGLWLSLVKIKKISQSQCIDFCSAF